MTQPNDKRRHPRIAQRLRVSTLDRETKLELETIDLSAGGLRCQAPSYVPPMTKMALSLGLPAVTGAGEHVIRGEAVVGRTQAPTPEAADRGTHPGPPLFSEMGPAARGKPS